MNEFNTLRSLRSDVPLPSSDDLAPAHARLEQAMAAEASGSAALVGSGAVGSGSRSAHPRRKSVKRRLAWIAGSMVGVVGLVFGAGQAAVAFNSQQTNARLQAIAGAAVEFDEVVPGPGQYLLSTSHSSTHACWSDEGEGTVTADCEPELTQSDLYMPADPNAEWVLVSDRGISGPLDPSSGLNSGGPERVAAVNGDFYGAMTQDPNSPEAFGVAMSRIPTESGEAAFKWVDEQYYGGSNSRSEDNFFRIQGLLSSGLVPAKQRASLIEALAMIPGVTSTPNVPNLDGVQGTAFGRTEPKRGNERTEIIIDPETGLVIGGRTLAGSGHTGATEGEVVFSVAVRTRVVDDVPSDATLATESTPPSAPSDKEDQD